MVVKVSDTHWLYFHFCPDGTWSAGKLCSNCKFEVYPIDEE